VVAFAPRGIAGIFTDLHPRLRWRDATAPASPDRRHE
jgi:hypothetical protein